MAEILEICMEPQIRTHMVYKTNLNFTTVKKYLAILINSNLLKCEDELYETTEKGKWWSIGLKNLTKDIIWEKPE